MARLKSAGVQWKRGLIAHAAVLNPGCLNGFFNRYACNNERATLDTLPGLIEAHAQQDLPCQSYSRDQ